MDILSILVIGLIGGWLAGKISRGHGFGLLGNMVIGVVGALLGGFLFRIVGLAAYGLVAQLLMATFGAITLLFLIGLVRRTA
jgi:uncharacterized membrane protein YeaQ/YmgE (transglycosylase-associated protein family)